MEYSGIKITRTLQSGFRLEWDKKVIYIDPFKIDSEKPKADWIFLTHEHGDHCDVDSLKKVIKPETEIYGNDFVRERLIDFENFRSVDLGQVCDLPEFSFESIPSYNTNKFRAPKVPFHPKESGGMGYLFSIPSEGKTVRIYHMGDTDFLPELQTKPDIDILMIPISGTYVMTKEEAIKAVEQIKPKIAIPMHYDAGFAGSQEDAKYFADKADTKVEIL